MIAEFLSMGGHGTFVWPCYLLTLGGMAWLGIASWRRERGAMKRLRMLTKEEIAGKGDDAG